MKRRQYILLLILMLIFELIFKSSNIPLLYLLDLLVLLFLIMLTKDTSFLIITLFLFTSMVIDVFSFQIIGLTGFCLFSSFLTIKIFGNFSSFLNIEKKSILNLIIIYILFVLLKYLFEVWLNNNGVFEIFPFFLNIVILVIFYWITGKFTNTKYVLK